MSRERWGTFSVRDHVRECPFATEVLMYDRLVIPQPANPEERSRWSKAGWAPDRLDSVLDILGVYDADEAKGHAITVQWDHYTEDLFKRRAETAKIVDEEANYGLTRRLLATELLPEAPQGVARVAILAAYPSVAAAEEEWTAYNEQEKRESLTFALAHQFVVPDSHGKTELELLQEAVDLANDTDFQRKRAQMYRWQDDVIRTGISNKEALEEMAQYVDEYNNATTKAVGKVYIKFAFTLIPIALTALGGPLGAAAALGSIANLVRFWVFDRKPVVEAGESQPAAMLHTIHQELGWHVASLNA